MGERDGYAVLTDGTHIPIREVTLNGVRYVRADLVPGPATEAKREILQIASSLACREGLITTDDLPMGMAEIRRRLEGQDRIVTDLAYRLWQIARSLLTPGPATEKMIDRKPNSAERANEKIRVAIEIAVRYGGRDGEHHKAWVIDQMVRILAGPEYDRVVADACSGEYGPDTYSWDVGIAP